MWLPCGKSDSQVEPGFSVLESFGGDGVKITFPEQHVVLPPDFDLSSILRVEEHAIFWLDRSDMGAHRHDLAPGEPAPDGDCRRDKDSAATAPLPGLVVGRDQNPIVQHADRQPALVQTG